MNPVPAAWQADLQEWEQRHPGPCVAVHDFDADGLSAATLWWLARRGELQVAHSRRHFDALSGQPALVYLLDLSPGEGLPWQQPTIGIDHHAPSSPPPAGYLALNAHDWQPSVCTSLLAHWLFWGEDSRHAWIAAVGALSDLGDAAPHSLLQRQLELHGRSKMRDLVSLINSAHRAEGDCGQALTALREHDTPKQLLRSKAACVAYLRECQARVRDRLNAALHTAPSCWGKLAVLEIRSDCPVHGLVAQIWRSRVPEQIVLVANHRTNREEVQISARCGSGCNAIEELAALGLELRGHPRSAGAALSPSEWDRFLASLEGYARR